MLTIEIAGVPFEVRCRFEEKNRNFFRDYLTENPPLFSIEPSEDDMERIREEFARISLSLGTKKTQDRDALVENNAIFGLAAEKLARYGALLVHGSALCMDGEAYIFTAPSGTGKSTHARLWREVFGDRVWMVNDDKPMLKIGESGVSVWGTPWMGKHRLGRNASAPLKAIVSLHRDETNHIEKMSKSDAFPVMLDQAYVSRDPATMARIMDLEKQLLDTVDFYTLGCDMRPEAALTAWKGMNR